MTTLAERLKLQADLAEQVMDWAHRDPEFVRRLIVEITSVLPPERRQPKQADPENRDRAVDTIREGTNADKIRRWFQSRGNEWATLRQLNAALDIPENSVHYVVQISHKDHFEKKRNPEGGRAYLFRYAGRSLTQGH